MTKIQLRRGIASLWTSQNPTLSAGEPGFETDTGKFKIGDGTTAWADLAYEGGAFPGWTADDANPANVSANGGTLALGGGEAEIGDDLVLSSVQDVPGEGDRIFARGYSLDGETVAYAIYYQREGRRALIGFYEEDATGVQDWYLDTGLEVSHVRLSLRGFDGQEQDIADFWTGRTNDSFTTDTFGSGAILVFNAFRPGISSVSVELVDPGSPSQPLSISLADAPLVSISLATDGGGTITTTAQDIVDAVTADPDASALLIATPDGVSDGTVEPLAETPLVGGVNRLQAWGLLGNGAEYLFAVPTPSDDSVQTSQRIQWYDATAGAPKLRLKEKDSDGTLVERISAVLTSDGTAFAGVTKPSVGTADAASILAALVTLGLVTDDT